MRIEIKDHPFLGDVDWSPQGLCAITGPNCSGKSTLLRVFHIMSINRYDDEYNWSNVKIDGQSLSVWFNNVYGPEDIDEDEDQEEEPSLPIKSPYRQHSEMYIPPEYWAQFAHMTHIVRDRPDQKWVWDQMKMAFPHLIKPDAQFLNWTPSLPFLRMMYDLRVVAQAQEGAVIPIDHPEDGLHPFAIRVMMDAFKEMVEQKNLTVILETMHPEVLNEFRGYEDQVYLLGHEPGKLITLADIVHEDELPIAYIGERFLRERFCPQSELARNRLTTKDLSCT